MKLQNTNGFSQEFGDFAENYVGKIVISSVSIGVAAVAALVSLVGLFLLDKLVVIEPNYPPISVSGCFDYAIFIFRPFCSYCPLKIYIYICSPQFVFYVF